MPALSPIPITSRPVRARLDQVKVDMSREFQQRLGRDATWNEVLERLLDAYAFTGPGIGGPAATREAILRRYAPPQPWKPEGESDDPDNG